MDLMVPAQPDPVAKYTVPLEATDTSSPVTPEETSVSRTAPVAGSSWTSAPAFVTATIPGFALLCVAGWDDAPPWAPPLGDPAPLAPDPAGALEDADDPPPNLHADATGSTATVSTTKPAASRARLEKARDAGGMLMARHDRAHGASGETTPGLWTFSDATHVTTCANPVVCQLPAELSVAGRRALVDGSALSSD